MQQSTDIRLELALTCFTHVIFAQRERAIANACWERDARLAGADLNCSAYDALSAESLAKEPLFPAGKFVYYPMHTHTGSELS